MTDKKINRNDPCPCGSGKKYKQCCQHNDAANSPAAKNRLLESVPDLFKQALKYQDNQQLNEAESIYERILDINPKHVDSLYHLGIIKIKISQSRIAIDLLQKAVHLEPSSKNYCTLAQAYQSTKQNDEALECLNTAIKLNPGDAIAYNNLGGHLLSIHHHQEAIETLQKSIALDRQQDAAFTNLGLCAMKLGKYQEAVHFFQQAIKLNPRQIQYTKSLLFCLCFDRVAFSNTYLNAAHQFDALLQSRATPYKEWPLTHNTTTPLRVGFVSGDLRQHPVGYFLESILQHINSSKISLFAYNTQPYEDDLTLKIRPYFAQWASIFPLNDAQAAQQIHNDGIHILIDLSGYTGGSRLPMFAYKPAPVQLSWLGYFASTGLSFIDYFLADPPSVPPHHRSQFTETVWYLPHTRLCFTPPSSDTAQAVSPLPALTHGFVTFGCFQSYGKINHTMLKLWASILQQCPNSRMIFKNSAMQDSLSKKEFISRLLDVNIPLERVVLEDISSRHLYLAAYSQVDFMLDTFPYPGGTTTCEALWMGVPTVTLAGNTLLERQGMSMLTCVGLNDWIAYDEDDYIQKAVSHAHDLSALNILRLTLREKMRISPLVDAPRFANDFENALHEMWHDKSLKA